MSSERKITEFVKMLMGDEISRDIITDLLARPKFDEVLASYGATKEEADALLKDLDQTMTQEQMHMLHDLAKCLDAPHGYMDGYCFAFCEECGQWYRIRHAVWTDENGDMQDRRLRCPTCHPEDIKAEDVLASLEDVAKNQRAEIIASMPDLLKKRGVGSKNRENTFENFHANAENETALKVAKEFVDNKDTAMLFIGPTGVGKNHLAVSVMVEFLKSGRECQLVKEAKLGRDISDSRCFNTKETINAMHARYCSYPLLVIDELGKGQWTNGEATEILDIIDDRIEEEDRKTILLSNLKWEDFLKRYGDRITSRLDGYGKMVRILDRDNRRALKNENGNDTAKLNTVSDAKFDTANALKKKSSEITQLSKIKATATNLEGGAKR